MAVATAIAPARDAVSDASNDANNDAINDPATDTVNDVNIKVSEQLLFAELQDVRDKICLLSTNDTSTTAASLSKAQRSQTVHQLKQILDKYLAYPTLLDRSVESIVQQISTACIQCLEAVQEWNRETVESGALPYLLSVLYALCKVRGRKRIQNFLSHEVGHLEVVWRALCAIGSVSDDRGMGSDQPLAQPHSPSQTQQQLSASNATSSDSFPQHPPATAAPDRWESVYSLWTWMGTFSLVPFDSKVVVGDGVIHKLVDLGMQHLQDAGPTRDIASSSLASWLARPDLQRDELERFVTWSREALVEFSRTKRHIFRCMGVLQTIVAFMKVSKSDRQDVLRVASSYWQPMNAIAESNPSNQILRRLLVKYWTRTATLHMPPRLVVWRYQRGRRSLKNNLRKAQRNSTTTNATQRTQKPPKQHAANDTSDNLLFEVPSEVEDVMGRILECLQDPSTSVRWSAAKGVGRITERLPAVCADDVLDAIVDLFEDIEKDHAWHGACLALAELARRGLLLPQRLDDVLPKVVDAMQYDLPRRQTSVGSHVRDAACYTYWACARAYDPSILKPFIPDMSRSIVETSLLDREVNCRRAASAAFQEMVGRQGADNFKNGLDILTLADYFSLGNRKNAYTAICWKVAEFAEYRHPLTDNLCRKKLKHWDENIRKLAATSLGGLVQLDPAYFASNVIPYLLETSVDPKSVISRHGAVIGLAEVILGYARNVPHYRDHLSDATLKEITDLVPTIEKRRLYRGKGGEMMRSAVCRLIECTATAELSLTVPQQVKLLDTIDACIPHPSDVIQKQACAGLGKLMSTYFQVGPKGPSDRLQKRVVDKYVKQVRTNTNPAATRGFSMALGYLPAKLLAPSEKVLDTVLATLCRFAKPNATVGNEKDAETRRNSVQALVRVCNTVGINGQAQAYPLSHLQSKQIGHVWNTLLAALADYNMDRRGDVGSWSRIAAMEGLVSFASLIQRDCGASNEYLNQERVLKILSGLFHQFTGKLDAVRGTAGECLQRVVRMKDPSFPHLPDAALLQELFNADAGADTDTDDVTQNWSSPCVAFPVAMKAASIDALFHSIVSGLIMSAGGLTESISKEAMRNLIQWIKATQALDRLNMLGDSFLRHFAEHKHQGHFINPLLKTIHLLMDKMCMNRLLESTDFAQRLLAQLEVEVQNCTDVTRILSISDVALGLLAAEDRDATLRFVVDVLKHQFPRVRRYMAEQLYVRLLEIPDLGRDDDAQMEASEYLLSTCWDAEMNEDECERMAEQVTTLLKDGSS